MADKVNPEAVAIGRAVRAALVAARFSLAEASERTGINLTTLSRRVNGTLPFTFPELARIAELCDIRVSDLALAAERIAAQSDSPCSAEPPEESSDAGTAWWIA